MTIVIAVALVLVFAVCVHALNRAAARGDEQMEEPAEWDDPDWEPEWLWPGRVRAARVDETIREMERSL